MLRDVSWSPRGPQTARALRPAPHSPEPAACSALVVAARGPAVDLDEFPRIGHPATRSLREAGYRSLRELVGVPRERLAQLNNIGPKSLHTIEAALRQHGLTLR